MRAAASAAAPDSPLRCPGRCPRRSTSRSSPASMPRRTRCRSPPRPPPPARRWTAHCWRRPCRSRRRSWTRRCVTSSTRRSCEPVAGRRGPLPVPARAAARGRLRDAAALVAPQGAQPPRATSSAATSRATGGSSRRTSSARNASARRPRRTSTRPSGRGGAGRWRRRASHLTRGDRPRREAARTTTPRPSRGRHAPAPGIPRDVGGGRRPAPTRPPTSIAASSSPASDPRGDDMFSTLICAVGLRPLARRARPRATHLGDARAGLDERTRLLPPQNLAGFGMLDWFAGQLR